MESLSQTLSWDWCQDFWVSHGLLNQESLGFLLAVSQRSPSLSHDMSLSMTQLAYSEWRNERAVVGAKDGSQCFWKLTLQVVSYNFCHILFLRSKLISVAKTQGERITQRFISQETTSSGAILEDSHHIKAEQYRNSRVTWEEIWRIESLIMEKTNSQEFGLYTNSQKGQT